MYLSLNGGFATDIKACRTNEEIKCAKRDAAIGSIEYDIIISSTGRYK